MQCNAMQCNAMQCNAMQCNAMQCNAMQCNAMQCNAMQCNKTLFIPVRAITIFVQTGIMHNVFQPPPKINLKNIQKVYARVALLTVGIEGFNESFDLRRCGVLAE